ncbi:protein kinase, partial [Candidatus Woesearchaeota archaeon]|nr:protein kinase [Candidatus Woesearchaeota archaeon]
DELARIDPSRFLELYLWATEPYQNPPEEGQIKREWEKENEKLGRIMTFAKHPELSAEIRGAFIEASEAQYDIKKGTLSQIYKSLGHLCESRKGEPIVPIRDGCYSFVKAVLDSGYVDAMDEEGIVSALKDIVRDESLNLSMMEAAVKAGRSGSLDDIFKIGQFKAEESFLRKLGSGAAGTTYLVHSPELDKDLAMKIVEEGFYSKDEAKILAGLGHENVVKIWYASGSNVLKSGKPVFAILMDYVDGPALGEVAGISEENAVSYCRQLLDGIAYLRRRGVFHRDLNTNNVKLTSDGVVKIIDFGIASQDPEAGPKDNRRYGGRSDLFSWGLLAYKLFTGEHLVLTREEDMSTTVYADTIARHKKSMRTRTGRLKRTYLQKIETKIPEQFRQGIKTALEYREDDSEVFTTIRKEYTDKEADSIRRREVEAILGRTVTDEEYRGLKDVLRK